MSIEQMRKTYSMSGLSQKDVNPDPLVQFQLWFEQARQPDLPDWMEVNAMTLSTADPRGQVTSRVVLLKGLESGKLLFYTNYESTKAQQMQANPRVSLCFLWPHLQRQVRVEGRVSKTDRVQSENYFRTRPRDSQLGAHVSRQSSQVESREVLEQRFAELEATYVDQEVPCPEDWGGYEVEASQFEFWQGRPGRLHDRLCYRRGDHGDWKIFRLAP